MAGRTFRLEEFFARLRITHHYIDIRRTLAAADREAVEIRGNVRYLIGVECKFRHTPVTAVLQDGADPFTFLIFQNQLRPKQVGPVVPTPGVRPMAKAAVDVEQNFSSGNRSRIADRSLRICDKTTASRRAGRYLRILCGSHDGNNAGSNADEDVSCAHVLPRPTAGLIWAGLCPGTGVCRPAG